MGKVLDETVIDSINSLQEFIFKQNVDAGWHSHPDGTPFSGKEQYDKFPVRIALCHSELSEALEGWRKDQMDDHLPDLHNEAVELADAMIRIAELAYIMGYSIGDIIDLKLAYNRNRPDHKPENRNLKNGKKI